MIQVREPDEFIVELRLIVRVKPRPYLSQMDANSCVREALSHLPMVEDEFGNLAQRVEDKANSLAEERSNQASHRLETR